jgi:uncharacterized protein YcbX
MRQPAIEIAALYRYPVKSMGGEELDSVAITSVGPVGDRNWAVIESETRSIRNAKRWPALLGFRARYLTPPLRDAYDEAVSPVEIEAPNGETCRSDDADCHRWLGDRLDRQVRLSRRRPAWDRDHYRLAKPRSEAEIAIELDMLDGEPRPDFGETRDPAMAELQTFATPPGSYVDAFPIHVVTRNSLDALKVMSGLDTSVGRFRPNLLLAVENVAGMPELDWVGCRLAIGDLVLRIQSPTLRCVMPSRAQPLFDLAPEPALTRALVDHCHRLLGVNAIVEQEGTVSRGDAVRIIQREA